MMKDHSSPKIPEGMSPTGYSSSRDIHRVTAGKDHELTIACDNLVSMITHFLGGRTIPCTKGFRRCACEKESMRDVWQGWLAVLPRHSSQIRYVSITPGCIEDCPSIGKRHSTLSGTSIVLSRTGDHIRTGMRCRFSAHSFHGASQIIQVDVVSWLEKLWKLPANTIDRSKTTNTLSAHGSVVVGTIGSGGQAVIHAVSENSDSNRKDGVK